MEHHAQGIGSITIPSKRSAVLIIGMGIVEFAGVDHLKKAPPVPSSAVLREPKRHGNCRRRSANAAPFFGQPVVTFSAKFQEWPKPAGARGGLLYGECTRDQNFVIDPSCCFPARSHSLQGL